MKLLLLNLLLYFCFAKKIINIIPKTINYESNMIFNRKLNSNFTLKMDKFHEIKIKIHNTDYDINNIK